MLWVEMCCAWEPSVDASRSPASGPSHCFWKSLLWVVVVVGSLPGQCEITECSALCLC